MRCKKDSVLAMSRSDDIERKKKQRYLNVFKRCQRMVSVLLLPNLNLTVIGKNINDQLLCVVC